MYTELLDFIKKAFDNDVSRKYWISKLDVKDSIKGYLLIKLNLL